MSFKDIIGQERAIKILTKSLKENKISSSYIFVGSEGTGKKLTAIEFTKAVNCLNLSKNSEACENCQSCNEISNLKINHYNKVLNAHTTSGGKGINVSKAVRGCGRETIAIGFLGGGRGRMIEEELREMGITTNFWHIEEKTRSNTIISDRKAAQHTLLSEPGPKITEYDLEMLKSIFYRAMSQCSVVTLSGSLPRGVPVNIYGDLISIAKERKVKAILNTSGEQFIKGLEKKPFLAKPDLRESNRVFGIKIDKEKDAIKAAKEVVQRGAEIGVVSLEQEKDI
ncbi:unnamed protein product, partial [marine sediment metagenome]